MSEPVRGGAWMRQRASKAKLAQLASIERQVAEGRLVIRQATAEERERYGIPSPTEREGDDARS